MICAARTPRARGARIPLSPRWSGRPVEARKILVRFQGVGRLDRRTPLMRATATPQLRWPSRPPPSRRVEVTGQCATLTAAGSTPVACSARAIFQGEDASGSHAPLATARVTRRTRPGRVTRREPHASSRHAPKARRALGDAYTPDRCSLIPGLRAQERSGALSRRVEDVHPRTGGTQHGHTSRRSWWCCLADFARASGPMHDVRRRGPTTAAGATRRHGIEAHLVERPVVNRSVLVRIQPIPPQ